MRATAVLCVRNEGAFLLEWIAHHLGVGFTDIVVASNDCQDGTDAMLDRLAEVAPVHHIRNDGPHDAGGVQFTALKAMDRHPAVRDADWLLALDVDEFVNIHVGDRTLRALLGALPEADAVTLTWRLFGNGGVVGFEDAPVTEQFTRAAPVIMQWPWRASMFKTLYRNDGTYGKLGVHRPRAPDKARLERVRWFDGEGRALSERYRMGPIFSPYGRSNYGLVQLNHYPLGAMESYIVKRDRGRAVHEADALGLDYWTERNWVEEEDLSIRGADGLRDSVLARLRADPVLAKLHAAAVAWRRARFETLMLEEPNRALFGRLLMSPPARPLSAQAAARLIRYGMADAERKSQTI
ncbi:glycosyltransferase family 2 protein [Maritimibacter sp. DP1N21-5]|uniref:glycosyltransferase family 2 protein n=1 Tax=Maritimibacter sp. DP1N21-5 TaxID=2836867 RepID=UPI001C469EF6|nr:glycosyltransferase family 2 protein [Maritimibacter sp. DP1N21-5]MBV7410136.1 glycosyltransferase family 2 protein [Maritimibacter sp. DP1N21-5]